MDIDNFIDFEPNDDDVEPFDATAHKKLLAGVSSLQKTQFIRKPTRTEPSTKRSEFDLVKRGTSNVSITDLANVLKKSAKLRKLGNELKTVARHRKVIRKPLEKPAEERLRRSINYDKSKAQLNRWDAVVTRNQATDHLSFPLNNPSAVDIIDKVTDENPFGYQIKSDLMVQMEVIHPKIVPTPDNDSENKIEKLTREEMIARSRELRLLKIRESQKRAKAHRQLKIKSKKYHRFLKRELLKKQMKEFEELQKIDPEAALGKLEQLEKHRVQERANLRHKNTGTWAKNLQVRAKYDKDVRKELSAQLSIGRELTEKRIVSDDDQDTDDEVKIEETQTTNDPFNPWMKKNGNVNQSEEVKSFVSGYRKYWADRNDNQDKLSKYFEIEESQPVEKQDIRLPKKKSKKLKEKPSIKATSKWLVEDIPERDENQFNDLLQTDDIDDMFDKAEEMLENKFREKIKNLQNSLKPPDKKNWKLNKTKETVPDLSFKKSAKRPNIDEELDIGGGKDENQLKLDKINKLTEMSQEKFDVNGNQQPIDDINPEKFIKIIPKHLRTALPDFQATGDGIDDDEDHDLANKRLTIAEAFADDDIVADFERDKDDDRQKNQPKDLDLTLPGWGCWGGAGINPNKTRRFILKFPKAEKRRDENKGSVIINETPNPKLREHQVSSLPFPFTSVKDFEASIRAPIGRSFVPEIAHRLLVKPSVTTKLGTIIDPMDEEILMKRPPAPRTKTDFRVRKMMEESK